MRYAVIMSRSASEQLSRFPFEVAEYLIDRILYLSDDPVSRSTRATFPLRRGQVFVCSRAVDEIDYEFTIAFDYGDDEKHIRISAILVDPPFQSE